MRIPPPPYSQLPKASQDVLNYLITVGSVPVPKGARFEGVILHGLTPAMDRRLTAVFNFFGRKPQRQVMHARKPRRAVRP